MVLSKARHLERITIETHGLEEAQASLPCREGKKEREKYINMG
jgi:hypothetical protein